MNENFSNSKLIDEEPSPNSSITQFENSSEVIDKYNLFANNLLNDLFGELKQTNINDFVQLTSSSIDLNENNTDLTSLNEDSNNSIKINLNESSDGFLDTSFGCFTSSSINSSTSQLPINILNANNQNYLSIENFITRRHSTDSNSNKNLNNDRCILLRPIHDSQKNPRDPISKRNASISTTIGCSLSHTKCFCCVEPFNREPLIIDSDNNNNNNNKKKNNNNEYTIRRHSFNSIELIKKFKFNDNMKHKNDSVLKSLNESFQTSSSVSSTTSRNYRTNSSSSNATTTSKNIVFKNQKNKPKINFLVSNDSLNSSVTTLNLQNQHTTSTSLPINNNSNNEDSMNSDSINLFNYSTDQNENTKYRQYNKVICKSLISSTKNTNTIKKKLTSKSAVVLSTSAPPGSSKFDKNNNSFNNSQDSSITYLLNDSKFLNCFIEDLFEESYRHVKSITR